jgi:hypothetical protein
MFNSKLLTYRAPFRRIGQEYSTNVVWSTFQSLKRIQPLPVCARFFICIRNSLDRPCGECNDIIESAKGSQISEKYWGEVGKGERADIYLEEERAYFFWMKQVPVIYIVRRIALTAHEKLKVKRANRLV